MRTRFSGSLITVAVCGLSTLLAPAAAAQAPWDNHLDSLIQRHLVPDAAGSSASGATHAPKARGNGPNVRLFRCDEAPGGRCGIVKVRLDRSQPPGESPRLPIFFEYYRHRNPGPTDQAILATLGGPGASVTGEPFFTDFTQNELFDPLLDTRDLIFLDQRGVGRSAAINCRRLQDGVPPSGDIYADLADCGAHLGSASALYGSDDVAKDIDRVRRALGIDQLDLYGGSYAAVDVQAYASRFPDHVRSAVLDSPFSAPGYDFFGFTVVDAIKRSIGLLCERSASCSVERGDAADSLEWLAEHLRTDPLDGVGHDASGNPREVHVTEGFLLWTVLWTDLGDFVSQSEIGAAADALQAGDEAPLLRLAAEHKGPLFPPEAPPRVYSVGDNFARFCTDFAHKMPWDTADATTERLAQWQGAVDALPDDSASPFAVDAWLSPFPTGVFGPDPCIAWPAPDRTLVAPIPAGVDLPGDVPALILSGDLDSDTPTAEAQVLADEWPNSSFVELANAGHHTAVTPRFECSHEIIEHFIANLDLGDTSCADDLEPLQYPAVGRFVVTADQAREAEVAGGGEDESTALDRQVATVATGAVTDTVRRSFFGGPEGRGLRGGRFTAAFGDTSLVSGLRNVRFSEDVAVSGHAEYPYESEDIEARVDVEGPGDEDGKLRIRGVWFGFRNTATELRIRGSLDGRQVALRVPAT